MSGGAKLRLTLDRFYLVRKFFLLVFDIVVTNINIILWFCGRFFFQIYLISNFAIRCFSFAWLAEYSANNLASLRLRFSTAFSSFSTPPSKESCALCASEIILTFSLNALQCYKIVLFMQSYVQ